MRIFPQFVPSQFVFGLLRLAAVSLSLPADASSVMYEIESESENSETAMSYEFRNDMDARLSARTTIFSSVKAISTWCLGLRKVGR